MLMRHLDSLFRDLELGTSSAVSSDSLDVCGVRLPRSPHLQASLQSRLHVRVNSLSS
jgi:hypothetical protein